MAGYTKLFASITDSTVWREPDRTRLVWITMLAMADADGIVSASVPGLADRARVPMEDCLKALDAFRSPDEWSRTKDYEGRRITDIDGGWQLLNHAKYRQVQDAERRREQSRLAMQALRAKRKGVSATVSEVSEVSKVSAVNVGDAQLTQAEAEAEATAEEKTQPLPFPEVRENLERLGLQAPKATAAEFAESIVAGMRALGWIVQTEVQVPDRGDGSAGRVDAVVRSPCVIGLEFDRSSVRSKSVIKLGQVEGYRVAMLRSATSSKPVAGLDAVLCCGTGEEGGAVTLPTWLAAMRERGEKAIPDGDPILAYADRIELPVEFLKLAWVAFKEKHSKPSGKRYVDWRQTFRNAVEGNWLNLWFVGDDGVYKLTTAGQQAQRATKAPA